MLDIFNDMDKVFAPTPSNVIEGIQDDIENTKLIDTNNSGNEVIPTNNNIVSTNPQENEIYSLLLDEIKQLKNQISEINTRKEDVNNDSSTVI